MAIRVRTQAQSGGSRVDDLVDLTEDAAVDLISVTDADDDEAEIDDDRLDEVIDRSDAQIARGETIPFEVVLQDVRRILQGA